MLELAWVEQDRKAQMAAVTPRLEDGGYIAGDDEEEESKTTSLARDARATVDLMRSTAAAAVQKISDPRVVSAAANSHAARSALGANRSAECADTLMSLQLQVLSRVGLLSAGSLSCEGAGSSWR